MHGIIQAGDQLSVLRSHLSKPVPGYILMYFILISEGRDYPQCDEVILTHFSALLTFTIQGLPSKCEIVSYKGKVSVGIQRDSVPDFDYFEEQI